MYLFELGLCFLVEEFIELLINIDRIFFFELLLIIHSILGLAVILTRFITHVDIRCFILLLIVHLPAIADLLVVFGSFDSIAESLIGLLYFLKSGLIFAFVHVGMVYFSESQIILLDIVLGCRGWDLQVLIQSFLSCGFIRSRR